MNAVKITEEGKAFLKECYKLLPEVNKIIDNSSFLSDMSKVTRSFTDKRDKK